MTSAGGQAANIASQQPSVRLKKFTDPTEIVKTKSEAINSVDWLAITVATAAGAGFMPKAPGTAGSVVGVAIYLALDWASAGAYYPHAIIFFFIVGIWASSRVEHMWGHDAQRIVIDEVIGQMITFGLAAGRYQLSAFYVALGFGLFRLFDILKPFPIRHLERIKGGVGVIADDVGAGFYALASLTLIRFVFLKSY